MKLFGGRTKQTDKSQESQYQGRQRPARADGARPQAFSYYSQRSGSSVNTGRSQSEPGLQKERSLASLNHNHMVFMLITAAGLLIAGYLLWLSSEPRIVLKTSAGSSYFAQDTKVYQESAAHSLSSSLLNRNKLTVDTEKVSKDITASYPEVATVKTRLPFFGHRPVVVIEPYAPSFILTTPTSAAFLLDENGRALISTSQIDGTDELYVPTLQDKSAIEVRLGSQVVSGTTVRFIQKVLAILDASDIGYGTLTLPEASNEVDVAISGTPYFVKFNLQGDARLQAGTFIAAKLRLEKDGVTPTQYIDVRVPERAYYL